jgi:hypothetical protein
VRNHPGAILHHLTNVPPSSENDEPSIDPRYFEALGIGTETKPFTIQRHAQPEHRAVNRIPQKRLRFVCMSDTHNEIHRLNIPDGDVFVHCGDAVNYETSARDLPIFNEFVGALPHRYKIFVSGNHCVSLDPNRPDLSQNLLFNMTYVQDQLVDIEGVKIYGTPWRPQRGCFYRSEAFGYDHEHIRNDKWSFIPESIDLLLTHGPPYSIRDYSTLHGDRVGCSGLLDEIVTRVKPRVHLFGHVHDCYGASLYKSKENSQLGETSSSSNPSRDILFANVAINRGRTLGEPIVIDYIY